MAKRPKDTFIPASDIDAWASHRGYLDKKGNLTPEFHKRVTRVKVMPSPGTSHGAPMPSAQSFNAWAAEDSRIRRIDKKLNKMSYAEKQSKTHEQAWKAAQKAGPKIQKLGFRERSEFFNNDPFAKKNFKTLKTKPRRSEEFKLANQANIQYGLLSGVYSGKDKQKVAKFHAKVEKNRKEFDTRVAVKKANLKGQRAEVVASLKAGGRRRGWNALTRPRTWRGRFV
jgi:hypothetical protein